MKYKFQELKPVLNFANEYQESIHKYLFPNLQYQNKPNILSRLCNMLMGPGKNTGKKYKVAKYLDSALIKLQEKIGKPKQDIIFKSVINSCVLVTVRYVKYGSITVMKKVITSPSKQVSMSLHNLAKSIKTRNPNIKVIDRIYRELFEAYNNSNKSYAIKTKLELARLAGNAN
jgi:ribosomal protein S7